MNELSYNLRTQYNNVISYVKSLSFTYGRDICSVVCTSKKDLIIEQGLEILNKFNLQPHEIIIDEPFNWERVTEHYNIKLLKPDDWWIVADDDELQLYSKPTYQIIEECEEYGHEFVCGGFVDRIGDNGNFPKITMESNVWEEIPEAGFFAVIH